MNQPPSRRKKAKATAQSNSKQPNNPAQEEDPASAIIDVTAVEVPEMTEAEQSDRLHLERRVERAFYLISSTMSTTLCTTKFDVV